MNGTGTAVLHGPEAHGERTRRSPARELLVVDDNPDDLELTLRALRSEHAAREAAVARNGAEALQFLFAEDRARDLRVVLLDLNLPGVDGREVLRRIRADGRTRTLPVVVLSSSGDDEDVRAVYALGASSYVVKPVEYGAFMETMARVAGYWLGVNEFVP